MFSGQINEPGNYLIQVKVSDGSDTITQQFTLTVDALNTAPQYQGITQSSVKEGVFYRRTVNFSDAEQAKVKVSVSGLPSWLHYNSETQELYGQTPLEGAKQYTISLTATDNQGASTQVNVQLNVTAQKVITLVPLTDQQL
ncbi:MAG: putative Ig domain-containing protein, partial [Alteromonadaceae bacterium]|nr:putative Ig domain-containing protein [Alteromonadaceae bacterium]